ncbi:MAG: DUF6020 family protein [Butyrivibrio sp.]|nr:DUF6020 family protein [Butyrivibrio sp.]
MTFGIHMLLWGIVFLAYWPGLFTNDIGWQLRQGYGDIYTTHHPLAHTLYMQFFYYFVGGRVLHNYNIAIAISILIQMAVASLSVGYGHLFLYKIGVNRVLRYALVLLTGVLPACSLIFICTTKDAYFSAFVVLGFTLACEYEFDCEIFDKYRAKYVFLALAIVGMILFRKNGIYPVIALVAIVIIRGAMRHDLHDRRRYVFSLVVGLLAGMVLLTGIKKMVGGYNGSINEMLSVPYQQIAYVYTVHEEELSLEEKEAILEILPKAMEYEPQRADPVKDYAEIYNKRSTLVKLWVKLGTRYFGDYVTAFLKLNAGYLCLTDLSYSEVYGTGNGKGIFITFFVDDDYGIEHRSLIPPLEWLYEKLYTDNYFKYVPVLNILCSPAFYSWIVLLLFAFSVIEGDFCSLAAFVFILAYIATLLLGPCALVRYALPYMLCVPVYGALVIKRLKI